MVSRRSRSAPDLVGAGPQFRPVGEAHPHVGEAQIGIDRDQQLEEIGTLRLDLLFGAEDMGVVLGEGPHPHDAVDGPRRLVAVAGAELRQAQRQIAIALQSLIEDQDMAGAVHRLQRQHIVLRLHHEDAVAEFVPMARGLPEAAVEKLGRAHLEIARRLEAFAQIALERAEQGPALGMPEDRAHRLLAQMEQPHLPADAPVVALLRLLQHMEIAVELFLVRPAGAVDALQLRVLRIAAPIGAGELRQLEGLAELARRGQMRAGAHVEPIALAVDGDLLVFGDLANPFGLEALAMLTEIIGDPVATPELARDLLVAVDDLAHALLDGGEIIRREGRLAGEIVIEAVLDRRPEGDLGAGIKLLHRLGQDMGAVVAQQIEGIGMGARDDLDAGVLLDGGVEIPERSVDLYGERRFGETGPDGGGQIGPGQRPLELAPTAVRKRNRDHGVECGHIRDGNI